MYGARRFLRVVQSFEAGAHDFLQIALSFVDHVDHLIGIAERGMIVDTGDDGLPNLFLLPISISEVQSEQAEFPQLVSDVLADIGDGAVGANDDLVGVLQSGELGTVRERHQPAARTFAFGFEADRARGREPLEGFAKEVEPQDGALAGQEVIVDPDPAHRFQVARHDSACHEPSNLGSRAFPGFEFVQGLAAESLALGVFSEPAPDFGVEVPAGVVEGLGKVSNGIDRQASQVDKTHDDIGQLHARVVDVVLDLHCPSQRAQKAGQDVAQNCVAQMADMRGLVRVDVGVFNDGLLAGLFRHRDERLFEQGGSHPSTIQVEVEKPRPLDSDLADTLR